MTKNLKKSLWLALAVILLTGLLFTVGGCGTIRGIGQDISDAGKWFQEHHNNGWKHD